MNTPRVLSVVSFVALGCALNGCAPIWEGEYRVTAITRRSPSESGSTGSCAGFTPPALSRVTRLRLVSEAGSPSLSAADLLIDASVVCRMRIEFADHDLFRVRGLDQCDVLVPAGTRFTEGWLYGGGLTGASLTWTRNSDSADGSSCKVSDVLSVTRL
jgi:hypothetical protein